MNTERDCTEVKERSTTTSTSSDIASQAWDKSQCTSTAKQSSDTTQTHLDCGNNDIYNTNKGNAELGTANKGLQCAENDINHTLNQIMDGNYDSSKVQSQLDTAWNHLFDSSDQSHDAIKHLGASSSERDINDMVGGRRDTVSARQEVSKAEVALQSGDEAGAIKSLLQSLGKIDGAQSDFSDVSAAKNSGKNNECDTNQSDRQSSSQNSSQESSQNSGGERFRPYFPNRGLRPVMNGTGEANQDDGSVLGGNSNFGQSGFRHNDMYRGYNSSTGGDFYGTSYNPSENSYQAQSDYSGGQSNQFDPFALPEYIYNQLTGANQNNGGDSNSQGQFQPPIPTIAQLNQIGDTVAGVVDPGHILPTPSDLSDPGKLAKKILDPLGIFG